MSVRVRVYVPGYRVGEVELDTEDETPIPAVAPGPNTEVVLVLKHDHEPRDILYLRGRLEDRL